MLCLVSANDRVTFNIPRSDLSGRILMNLLSSVQENSLENE